MPAVPHTLRRSDAAAFLGITPRTLDRWAQHRRGPKRVRLSPRVTVYRVADLEQFLTQHAVSGVS